MMREKDREREREGGREWTLTACSVVWKLTNAQFLSTKILICRERENVNKRKTQGKRQFLLSLPSFSLTCSMFPYLPKRERMSLSMTSCVMFPTQRLRHAFPGSKKCVRKIFRREREGEEGERERGGERRMRRVEESGSTRGWLGRVEFSPSDFEVISPYILAPPSPETPEKKKE
jgi:hypothetical protein